MRCAVNRPLALCLTLLATACVQPPAAETSDGSAPDLATAATASTATASSAPTESGLPPTPEPSTDAFIGVTLPSDGLLAYEMAGITITYTANASLEETEPTRVRILGPSFPFQGVPDGSPSYDLTIEIHDNPGDLSADAWARKRILDAWQAARAADQPPGGLPVTDGEIREDWVRDTQVAGRPALRIEFNAFDSYVSHYYLALGDRIVEIQHPVNIEGNLPYAKLQDDVHRLLLGALRFDEPGGMSGVEVGQVRQITMQYLP